MNVANEWKDYEILDMANGEKAKISIKDGKVFINDAEVVIADINATNGIIHIIDTVLMPK